MMMKNKLLPTASIRQTGGTAIQGTSAVGQQLLPLASRKVRGSTVRSVYELEDGRIVLVEDDVVYWVKVKPASDGEYPLLHAGRVVVKSGKATAVVGQPAAPALSAPVD
ncbi:MAG: hypothetical protein ACXW16_06750 [Burkholderiaceae bacterium]